MRRREFISLIGGAAALLLAGLMATRAFAFSGGDNSRHYAYCICNFGYGELCQVAVSCGAEGGRCGKRCRPENEPKGSNRRSRGKP